MNSAQQFMMNILHPSNLPKLRFFKLTTHNELHHGFQYTTGLNIDSLQFNPTGECSSGGLYFLMKLN